MVFIYIHITDSLSEWNMENIIFWEVHIWEPHQGSCKLDELLCSPGSPTSTSIMTWPLWPFLRIPCLSCSQPHFSASHVNAFADIYCLKAITPAQEM